MLTIDEKRELIRNDTSTDLSINERLALIGLSSSSYYYSVVTVDEKTETLMRLLDERYTQYPFEGKIKRARGLTQQVRYSVGRKRVKTLMEKMGISTVYPKPNTSAGNKQHAVYPYLLRDFVITKPNQVWCSDITYVPILGSHVYLTVIMDWYSRYVLEWELSITLEADFCVAALKRALQTSCCDVFNTDQGSQYTSSHWIETLVAAQVTISMDGRGRYLDNIFVERLWRSVKQECIYLHSFASVREVKTALTDYFEFYNNHREHQGLDYHTPADIYYGRCHYDRSAMGQDKVSIDNV